MPPDSGLVSIVKSHGYYGQYHYNFEEQKKVDWGSDYTNFEIMAADGKAVLLLRNPYTCIYGYRHLIQAEDHTGQTNAASQFVGTGIVCTEILWQNFYRYINSYKHMIQT